MSTVKHKNHNIFNSRGTSRIVWVKKSSIRTVDILNAPLRKPDNQIINTIYRKKNTQLLREVKGIASLYRKLRQKKIYRSGRNFDFLKHQHQTSILIKQEVKSYMKRHKLNYTSMSAIIGIKRQPFTRYLTEINKTLSFPNLLKILILLNLDVKNKEVVKLKAGQKYPSDALDNFTENLNRIAREHVALHKHPRTLSDRVWRIHKSSLQKIQQKKLTLNSQIILRLLPKIHKSIYQLCQPNKNI